MPITMSSASLPVFQHMLGNLSYLLDKAASNAEARKFDPSVLLQSRLAPDMLPFARQVLIACDGVTYAGRDHDRRAVVAEMCAALPTVKHVLVHANLGLDISQAKFASDLVANFVDLKAVTARNDAETDGFEPLWLPFDHPLWIVYSSGTTGLPKPIVHGHGGTIIVALALKSLHNDIGCSYHPNTLGERFHWYSSTGWVMWNAQVAGLLNGTTCVIYDGNPGGTKDKPDWATLWRFAAERGVTFFGAGAAAATGAAAAAAGAGAAASGAHLLAPTTSLSHSQATGTSPDFASTAAPGVQ